MIFEGVFYFCLVCFIEDDFRRVDCLQMILKWKGVKFDQGEYERVVIDVVDNKKNIFLYYVVVLGMKVCVEFLVKYGGDLFVENENKDIFCDCVEK